MELARPEIPEKPPVAVKPRLRTAPPRPPKPSVSTSLSTLSENDHEKGHSKEPHTFQNGAPRTSSTSALEPNPTISARANSADTLSTSFENTSLKCLEQSSPPSSPPSVKGKDSLSPSSTLSLPASFRNRGVKKADDHTRTTLTPHTPSTPVSSSLLQQSSKRHVTPPKKALPPASPKPGHNLSSSLEIVHNTRELKENKELRPNGNDIKPLHAKSEKAESTHLKTHTDSKPGISNSPVCSQSRTTPQRPTSPPSRTAFLPRRPSHPPSKALSPSASTRLLENSSVLASGKDATITADAKSSSERKPVVPPPLPKNPPRGGILTRPRQSSFRLTPTSDKLTLLEGQQSAEATLPTHDYPEDTAHLEKLPLQHNQNRPAKLLNDSNIAVVNTIDASQDNGETKLEIVKNNVPDSHINLPKTRIPPKPRPRTRPGLLALVNSEDLNQTSTSVDSDKNKINQNSISESAKTDTSIEREAELQCSDISQGDLDDHIVSGVEKCKSEPEKDISQISVLSDVKTHPSDLNNDETSELSKNSQSPKQSDTNIDQTAQTIEATSAISTHSPSPKSKDVNIFQTGHVRPEASSKPQWKVTEILPESPCRESHNHLNSTESASNNEITKTASVTDDSKNLLHEEPESTCGMLKEIEELLKNKLGNIQLDIVDKSTNNSNINSQEIQDTGHYLAGETEASCDKSICDPKHVSSLYSSPIRPPRPKRQASKNFGSLESLNISVDNSSTEHLADSELTKVNGLSSGSCKKAIPLKPKRTSSPQVNRSHSDVTGMKSILDSNSCTSESSEQLNQDEVKPFLPPRLESLRRSELSSPCHSPPPLPPRNKPRSASLKEIEGAGSEPPPLPSRSSFNELNINSKTEPEMAENLDRSSSCENIMQPKSKSAQMIPKVSSSTKKLSKITSSPKLRPTRKAPPPPQSLPRRSATFSSGDNKQPDSGQSSEQAQADGVDITQSAAPATITRSTSVLCKHPSDEVEDHEYHEISDHLKTTGEVSSEEKEETQPSTHPAQPSKTDLEGSHAAVVNDIPEDNSISLSQNGATYHITDSSSEIPETPTISESSPEATNLSPKEQKHLSLIKKMSQGLGLGKSLKLSKVPDISLVLEKPSTVTDESDKNKVNTISNDLVESVKHNIDSDFVSSIAMQDAEDFSQTAAAISTETHCSSTSSLDRPLSEVSQQSTSSEQVGKESQNTEEIVSSGTDTEPEEDKEEIYVQRKAKKVFFIAKEIVSSESTFVDVLKLLNLDFRLHISKSTETLGQPVVPSETLNKILDFLPQLQNFNEDLLKDLSERIENWETNPRLADIFVKKGPFLKLYSAYIRNFENATAVLEDTMKKNSVFASALKEFEMSHRCAKLALKHYMLKPIQRIPQYKLLLQDYLKHLTEGSPDYKDTITALNIVSEVADHANASMRNGDNVQKLLEIQRSLIGQFEVIQPGRILIKQGELQKLSRKEMQPRMFFLFNDVLLYTTPVTTGYKIINILPLTGMKINFPKLDDYKFEFNIMSVQRSFTLSCSSSEEKEQWVSALQSAIEENAKKHHTFQAVKHGTQTSLLDKDFILGHKAPLWVPDARVTMCMLCLLEFTLTWRRHHCRSCGRVVCAHCSENKAQLQYLKNAPARVCDSCFEILKMDPTSQCHQTQGKKKRRTLSLSEEDSTTSVSEEVGEDMTDADNEEEGGSEAVKQDSGLSLNHLMAKFQKIRMSNLDKRRPSNFRPSVLKEVHANDEGSDMSGYLRVYRARKWKRLWFVVKGKVLYTYKASEDMAAAESMPLLGYEVTRMNTCFEGVKPDLLFELTHQNNQPLATRREGKKVGSFMIPGIEKTTQRLIFQTDSDAATTKWLTVLREASLTYE